MKTIYASFLNPADGKKAVGALLDHGGDKEGISLLVREDAKPGVDIEQDSLQPHVDDAPKTGITTTTAADAGAGAAMGAGAGMVLGAAAAVASLVIPGFGIVIGGGALATAIGAALGTAAGGALAGGVAGYLQDLGLPKEHAKRYEETLHSGGAMLAVAVPCGNLDVTAIGTILLKYNAGFHDTYVNATAAPSFVTEP